MPLLELKNHYKNKGRSNLLLKMTGFTITSEYEDTATASSWESPIYGLSALFPVGADIK